MKGEVSGQITGDGVALGAGACDRGARVDTGEVVSFGTTTSATAVPIPFAIPLDPATIDPDALYVVKARVISGTTTWEDSTGVPVITNDNPMVGVTVTVTEVAVPSPSPSPRPSASPAPVPPDESGGESQTLLILVLVILGAVGAGAIFIWYRNRSTTGGVN
jgi:hypothetical protein